MNIGTRGDMAHSYALQFRNTALKQDMQRLTIEISSGQVADVRKALGANTSYLADLNRSMTRLDAYDLATQEAMQFTGGVQTALTRLSDLNDTFRTAMITANTSAFGGTSTSIPVKAKDTLEQVVSTLNTNVAGRSLFAGTATDTNPIATADTILAELRSAIAGAGSVDDILTAAQTWFDDPAGFGATGYLGSDTGLAPVSLSDSDTAQFDLRGDDPIFRDTLRNLAVLALAEDPALGLTGPQKNELLQKMTPNVLSSSDDVIRLQAKVGVSEKRIEALSARHSSERSALEMARSTLLSVDPFEAATELEQVQFQLQSLYAITARSSQLSLVNYL